MQVRFTRPCQEAIGMSVDSLLAQAVVGAVNTWPPIRATAASK